MPIDCDIERGITAKPRSSKHPNQPAQRYTGLMSLSFFQNLDPRSTIPPNQNWGKKNNPPGPSTSPHLDPKTQPSSYPNTPTFPTDAGNLRPCIFPSPQYIHSAWSQASEGGRGKKIRNRELQIKNTSPSPPQTGLHHSKRLAIHPALTPAPAYPNLSFLRPEERAWKDMYMMRATKERERMGIVIVSVLDIFLCVCLCIYIEILHTHSR